MKYYMAPLEEVTEAIYRNAYHAFFFPMDKYFAPFISAKPKKGRLFNYREKRDILPENNQNLYLVPQILTNQSEDFLRTVKGLMEYGYQEVNLNLGCPSRPVVNGGRGSGFLEKKEKLKQFLDEIFDKCPIEISIKTRLGRYHEEEIDELFELFSNYPYEELIVHPRVQTDYYKGSPRFDAFAGVYQKNEKPLIYNGDIFTKEDYEDVVKRFPKIDGVMLGRGVLANPGLLSVIHGQELPSLEVWGAFLERLYQDFTENAVNEEKALFKLKEIWCYLRYSFPKMDIWNTKIKRCQNLKEYRMAVEELLKHYPEIPNGAFGKLDEEGR